MVFGVSPDQPGPVKPAPRYAYGWLPGVRATEPVVLLTFTPSRYSVCAVPEEVRTAWCHLPSLTAAGVCSPVVHFWLIAPTQS